MLPKLNLNQGLVRVRTTRKPTRAEYLYLYITAYGLTASRSVSVKESLHIDAVEHSDVEEILSEDGQNTSTSCPQERAVYRESESESKRGGGWVLFFKNSTFKTNMDSARLY